MASENQSYVSINIQIRLSILNRYKQNLIYHENVHPYSLDDGEFSTDGYDLPHTTYPGIVTTYFLLHDHFLQKI